MIKSKCCGAIAIAGTGSSSNVHICDRCGEHCKIIDCNDCPNGVLQHFKIQCNACVQED